MRFSVAVLPALAASAFAVAIPAAIPSSNSTSQYGSWQVSATVSPDHSVYVTSTYTSDAYPDGLTRSCAENPFATPPLPKRCDRLDFTYEYDAQTIKLQQTVDEVTLFGEAYMPYTESLGDGRVRAHAVVPVTKAIA